MAEAQTDGDKSRERDHRGDDARRASHGGAAASFVVRRHAPASHRTGTLGRRRGVAELGPCSGEQLVGWSRWAHVGFSRSVGGGYRLGR